MSSACLPRSVNLEHLRHIMYLRLEEIFQLIESDLAQAGLLECLRGGVFICGGGARVPHIDKLARRVFQLPVTLGRANLHQRPQIYTPRPAGVRRRHRPGQIRLAPPEAARRRLAAGRPAQQGPHHLPIRRLNHDCPRMKTENIPNSGPRNCSIKIIGVGSAGTGVLRQLQLSADSACAMLALNSDAVTDMECLPLDAKVLRAVDATEAASTEATLGEALPKLKDWCAGADVVFIVAGLGGKTGSAVSHVAAQVARESGALVLGFVAMPFEFEGGRRLRQARMGLDKLKAAADGVVCLPNQKIFKLVDENTSVLDAFRVASELLAGAVAAARAACSLPAG